ncbi:hypothetical protein L3X38_037681 [Prunus dulcis]|uniref:Uncharacterized protein n=1 Tax=Prunus dulcis TaxID=3755 RepID=A0AAD4V545_PRUDU|nr:hypothetical protein L3X38_037681 [Prunus dulcis]
MLSLCYLNGLEDVESALNGLEDVEGCIWLWHGWPLRAWSCFRCMGSSTGRRAPLRSLLSTSFVAMASIGIGDPCSILNFAHVLYMSSFVTKVTMVFESVAIVDGVSLAVAMIAVQVRVGLCRGSKRKIVGWQLLALFRRQLALLLMIADK